MTSARSIRCAISRRASRVCRIGRVVDADLTLATDEIKADLAKSAAMLEKLGARIEPFKLPQSFESFTRSTGIIIASEGYANWRALIDDPKSGMADPIRARFLGGKTITAPDYLDVMRAARQIDRHLPRRHGPARRADPADDPVPRDAGRRGRREPVADGALHALGQLPRAVRARGADGAEQGPACR